LKDKKDMAERNIIRIEEDKCNGCGLCIPNCPEGAIRIIDGKARLISDLFCDGLGACLGYCPQGAISIEKRQAGEYSEKEVMHNIVKQGNNVIRAHLEHLRAHNEGSLLREASSYLKEKSIANPLTEPAATNSDLPCGCLGPKVTDFRDEIKTPKSDTKARRISELGHWPLQLMLVPPQAPFLKGADLLIAADCVPFSYAAFHEDLLKDKVLLVGCPKLDNIEIYRQKLNQVICNNNLKSITHVHMEVPCCFGLVNIIKEAISASGQDLPFQEIIISIKGERVK